MADQQSDGPAEPRQDDFFPSGSANTVDVSPARGIPFPIVGIGASAGGLQAVKELLEALPTNTGMAFVLVQHLDPTHESQLREILQTTTRMSVRTVTDGVKVRQNTFYIIPPNATMVLLDGHLQLAPREPGLPLPIDMFFRSLAEVQGGRSIGVVLSGNASDGSEGLRAIKAECGITFAQDEATATFGGMPRNAVATGAVDYVLPPAEIAHELARLGNHPYLLPPEPDRADLEILPDGDAELKKIFALLQSVTSVDFSAYKPTTVRRRIGRRMMVNRIHQLSDYVRLLNENRPEIQELYRDLLITVTSFFREPGTFTAIAQLIRKELEDNPRRKSALRAWIPGCSTGEEVYSLAICLYELLQELRLPIQLQLFGTDISETALERARAGVYSEIITHDVSPERLSRHFSKVDSGFQISKAIRESCIFARQDLARDPPFSHMDIISCRNVLIYMTVALQKRILPIFHYSLNPQGFLMLGSAESPAVADDLFQLVDKESHIYGRKAVPVRMTVGLDRTLADLEEPRVTRATPSTADLHKRIERVLQTKYSPPAIVINSEMQILHFRGQTSPFLGPSPGDASLNLLRMARENLVVPLRRAVHSAREKGAFVQEMAANVDVGGERRDVSIEITPIAGSLPGETHYLIVFETSEPRKTPEQPPQVVTGTEADSYIRQIQTELIETHEYLRNLTEDYEAYSEELRAANEEVRSSNEELQSANEELGTTKEELQSANEELTTVNEELQNRNQELSTSNNDLKNLLGAVQIPIVMIDGDLRLRRFTGPAEKLLEVGAMDIGRPIGHIRGSVVIPDVERRVHTVLETLNVDQRELQDDRGRWYSVTIRPYRTVDNRIDGAVITYLDIDPFKRALQSALEARQYAEGMIETVREPLLVLDSDLRVQRATAPFYEMFRVTREETIDRFFYDLGNGQWNDPRLRELLGNALFRDQPFVDFEMQRDIPNIGVRTVRLNARRIPLSDKHSRMVLVAIEDVTERFAESELRYRQLFEGATDGIIVIDLETGLIADVNPGLLEMTGYGREDFISQPITEIALFSTSGAGATLVGETSEHDAANTLELQLLHASGRSIWADVFTNHFKFGSRTLLQMTIRSATQRRAAASALRQSEERHRFFLESVHDYALIQLDLNGRIVGWNIGAERLLGFPEAEILGHSANIFFTPEDRKAGALEQEMRQARDDGRSEIEGWRTVKGGSRFFATGVLSPIRDDAGRLRGYSYVMRDITERRAADEKLQKSLQEKEVLLREVHHRVKNNLQVVASLLNLQAEHIRDPETAVSMQEMRTRIHSIATIHELLYGASDLSHIPFNEYLARLVGDVRSFYSLQPGLIAIRVEAQPISLTIAQAVPSALVINELLTNSIKHAFPDGRTGEIELRATQKDHTITVEVADNGVGLSKQIDLADPPTMGFQLVTMLAEQLRAELSVERRNGTQVRLQFPIKLELDRDGDETGGT